MAMDWRWLGGCAPGHGLVVYSRVVVVAVRAAGQCWRWGRRALACAQQEAKEVQEVKDRKYSVHNSCSGPEKTKAFIH